jgi:4-carboxymuconolactone decarboxylase
MTNDPFKQIFEKMMEQGQQMAAAFKPALDGLDVKGFEKLFPTMPADMAEVWFGKTYNPDGLDGRTRLLVTIAALSVLGAPNKDQLAQTIRQALIAKATKREIVEVIWQMSMFGGLVSMQKALEIAQAVFAETDDETGEKAK